MKLAVLYVIKISVLFLCVWIDLSIVKAFWTTGLIQEQMTFVILLDFHYIKSRLEAAGIVDIMGGSFPLEGEYN